MMKKQTVILYTRVRSKQMDNGKCCLQEQMDTLKQYCSVHNIKVVGLYEDIGSASSPGHLEGMQQALLNYATRNQGNIDLLMVTGLDRFSRTSAESIEMDQRLEDMGISIVSVTRCPNLFHEQFKHLL